VNEVGRTDFIGLRDRTGIVVAGHHDDRHVDAGTHRAQRAADVEAVRAGQLDVQQDQVGPGLLEGGERLVRRARDLGGVSRLHQRFARQDGENRIVVDDQHGTADLALLRARLDACGVETIGKRILQHGGSILA
jgi:hypothetical protein